ncbi:MAG: hypothetical protein R3E96_10580 [Planctomycetota bacterium]
MWSLALTLLACLPAETLSLEQLIERARAAQAAAQGSIQPRLEEILGRLADRSEGHRTALPTLAARGHGRARRSLLVAAMAGAAEGNPMLAGRLQEVLPGFDDLGTVLRLIAIVEDNQPTPMRLALPVLAQASTANGSRRACAAGGLEPRGRSRRSGARLHQLAARAAS